MSVPRLSVGVEIGTDVVSLAAVLLAAEVDVQFSRVRVMNRHADAAILYVGCGDSADPPTTDDMLALAKLTLFEIDGADASDRVFLAASEAATPVVLWLE